MGIHERGSVIQVKVLGVFAMIDEGETDWKVMAVDVKDPLAENLNDINDVEKVCPGLLAATVEWFKIYKMPDGKPANQFAFDSKPKDREFAEGIIEGTHQSWKKLISGETDGKGISLSNTTLANSTSISAADGAAVIAQHPEVADDLPLPAGVHKWHHITL